MAVLRKDDASHGVEKLIDNANNPPYEGKT